MFGWNFDGLALAIEQHLQQCMEALEDIGDIAMESDKAEEAVSSYTAALSLNPSNPAGLLVKRSKAWASQSSWEDSLKDADEVFSFSSLKYAKMLNFMTSGN
jgi:cytochrome c-type biogenesis protein CcmH/NrfG